MCCYMFSSWKVATAYKLPIAPSDKNVALGLSHISDNLVFFMSQLHSIYHSETE